eukprot:CAMPEP_0171165902 /NCGR_PEP_ID=MMETSP0790-20130122/6419_1 /TAXON_ID=2925 /ORGANISM="Alexandrium catenella, Strain OF101" /LENGTH=64 /DNA_ID=CAMNT_0011630695 /DNA_START=12 /DNA_END=202 /DNA_ORIENTATION=-
MASMAMVLPANCVTIVTTIVLSHLHSMALLESTAGLAKVMKRETPETSAKVLKGITTLRERVTA